jgi:hypothetical protein
LRSVAAEADSAATFASESRSAHGFGFRAILDRRGRPPGRTAAFPIDRAAGDGHLLRDGLRFAREGRSFLLWGGPKDPAERWAQFWLGWRSIGKVFVLAIVLDVIYQLWVLHWVYVPQLLFVAVVVAVLPYLLVRGAVNFLAAIRRRRQPPDNPS